MRLKTKTKIPLWKATRRDPPPESLAGNARRAVARRRSVLASRDACVCPGALRRARVRRRCGSFRRGRTVKPKAQLVTVTCRDGAKTHTRSAIARIGTDPEARGAQLTAALQLVFPLSTPELRIEPLRPHRQKPVVAPALPYKVGWPQRAERQAITYARWLAARDGIELPTYHDQPRALWSGVESKLRRASNGRFCFEPRIRAVAWGHDEAIFNVRKDGRRGAWCGKRFESAFEMPLPHWDWRPNMTEESQ